MKKKVSLMLTVILILQIMLPMLTVIWESGFTIKSVAAATLETTVDGIVWTYTLDGENNAIDVKPKDINSLPQEVTIPSTLDEHIVTSIGDYAFYGCISLTSITIPEGVTSIGSHAFSKCSSLTSIEIPEGVTSIGDYAFAYCSSLTSIEIPEGVTSIGSHAFFECSSLTNIKIPEGVTSIGDDAFRDCRSLTSIEIPEGVTSIGYCAFARCSSLTSINVNENNQNYSSVDGVLFDKNKTALIEYPVGKTDTEYVIPNSVTIIGSSAFFECSSLTSITIPERVTSIGRSAFYGCSSLTSIEIPEGVTSIGNAAFYECSSLTSIEIPEGVTNIEDFTFSYCRSLTSITIPNSVTGIEKFAFQDCSSLTSIEIPEGVTSIEDRAFYSCSSLTSITIPEGVKNIGDNAFAGCRSLTIYCRSNSYAKTYAETNSISYIIDDEAPTITSIEGNPEDWTKENVTLTINAEDALSGLATEAYSFDGGATWQAENTKTYEENTNDIIIKVRDNLGNIATQSVNITKIDKDAPTITSIEGNPEDWTKENVTLTINAEDTLSGLATEAYSFDGGATWQAENTKTYTENTNGIVVKVRDNLGNIKTYEEEINITKIVELESIQVKTMPNKISYYEGEKLNTEGLVLLLTYNNGTTEEIMNGFSYTPETLNTVGNQEIVVAYRNKTARFSVEVKAKTQPDPEPEKLLKGDVNGDGKVDFKDILLINKHRLNKIKLTGKYLKAAEVNGDSKVDITDILMINKYRLGKINSL